MNSYSCFPTSGSMERFGKSCSTQLKTRGVTIRIDVLIKLWNTPISSVQKKLRRQLYLEIPKWHVDVHFLLSSPTFLNNQAVLKDEKCGSL